MFSFHRNSAGRQTPSFLDKATEVHTGKMREGRLKAEGNGEKILGEKFHITSSTQ